MRTWRGRRLGANARYLGLSALGSLTGVAVLLVADDRTAHSRSYVSTPQFKVWTIVMVSVWAAAPTVWRIGVTQLRRALAQVGRDAHLDGLPRRNLRWLLVGIVGLLLAAWSSGAYAHPGNFQLYDLGLVRLMVTYVVAAVALYPVFLTFAVVYQELRPDNVTPEADDAKVMARIAHATAWRSTLTTCLTAAGSLVTIGVLATGAQRQALLAVDSTARSYPSAYVIMWGVVASAILLTGFVPAYRRLTELGVTTVDTVFPLVTPRSPDWRQRLADRAALGELLQIGKSFSDVLTSSLVVAAPLLSATFSALLPSGS